MKRSNDCAPSANCRSDAPARLADIWHGSKNQQLITGKVLELTAPEVFKHSFKFAGPDQPDSTVTYALTNSGGQTQLTVTHEGYGPDSQPYADIAGGWPIILGGLKALLEKK